jgi:hypothetical protein
MGAFLVPCHGNGTWLGGRRTGDGNKLFSLARRFYGRVLRCLLVTDRIPPSTRAAETAAAHHHHNDLLRPDPFHIIVFD